MRINVPNQLTLGRLVLAIVFFVLLAQYSQREPKSWLLDACLAIFIIAAVTDFLDGHLARRQNQVTALGRVLDPFADKVLVCGAFVFFASPAFWSDAGGNVTGVKAWMVVVIIGRELFVSGLRGFSESQGISFGAEFIGKAKMWTQSVTVGVVLLSVARRGLGPSPNADLIQQAFVWLTVVVTAASLVAYLIKAKAILLDASRR